MGDENYFNITPLRSPAKQQQSQTSWSSAVTPTLQHGQEVNGNIPSPVQLNGEPSSKHSLNHSLSMPVGVSSSDAPNAARIQTERIRRGSGQSDGSTNNLEAWDPMGADYSCPEFNCYKNFDILASEPPKERSPEKLVKSPAQDKSQEEISLYVGNIPVQITQAGLRNLFQGAGVVHSCYVPSNDPSRERKIGFVSFLSWKEASKAIEFYDGFSLGGDVKLKVKVARQKRQHGTDLPNDYSFDEGNNSDTPDSFSFTSAVEPNQSVETEKTQVNEASIVSTQNSVNHQSSHISASPDSSTDNPQPCIRCQKLCTTRCTACKANYCSRECQKLDRPVHKKACKSNKKATTSSSQPRSIAKQQDDDEAGSLSDIDFDCIDISIDAGNDIKKKTISLAKNQLASPCEKEILEQVTNHVDQSQTQRLAGAAIVPAQLPPSPSISSGSMNVLVTSVANGNSFWCQVVDEYASSRLVGITQEFSMLDESSLQRVLEPVHGLHCLARFSLDNGWYRSKVEEISGNQVKVMFVDYGNAEWKMASDLFCLPERFFDLPAQARIFTLVSVVAQTGSDVVDKELMVFLDGLVSMQLFEATIVGIVPGQSPEVILKEPSAQKTINETVAEKQKCLEGDVNANIVPSSSLLSLAIPSSFGTPPPQSMPSPSTPTQSVLSTTSSTLSQSVPPQSMYPEAVSSSYVKPAAAAYEPPSTTSTPHNPSPPPNPSSYMPPLSTQPSSTSTPSLSSTQPPSAPTPPPDPTQTGPTPTNTPARRPSCDSAFKTYMASDMPSEVFPSEKDVDIFVSDVATPAHFSIQFPSTAIERLGRLESALDATYRDSSYTDYVPCVGELVVAKFSIDGMWYRAKVDVFYNDGTLRVTFVDHGNSDDVRVVDVRRVTPELVTMPKLAVQCSLAGIISQSKTWSAESIDMCKTLMLNKLCIGDVVGHDGVVMLSVQVGIGDTICMVSDELVKHGHAILQVSQTQHGQNLSQDSAATIRSGDSSGRSTPNLQPFTSGASTSQYMPIAAQPIAAYSTSSHSMPSSPHCRPAVDTSTGQFSQNPPSTVSGTTSGQLIPNFPQSTSNSSSDQFMLTAPQPTIDTSQSTSQNPPSSVTTNGQSMPNQPPSSNMVYYDIRSPSPIGQNVRPPQQATPPLDPSPMPTSTTNPSSSGTYDESSNPSTSQSDADRFSPSTSNPVSYQHGGNIPHPYPNKPPTPDPQGHSMPPSTANNPPTHHHHTGIATHPHPNQPGLQTNSVPPSTTINPPIHPAGNTPHPHTNQPPISVPQTNPMPPPTANNPPTHHYHPGGNTPHSHSNPTPPPPPDPNTTSSNNSIPSTKNPSASFLPEPLIPSTGFDVVVNDVISANEFYAQMIEPGVVSQLHKCVRELNQFCNSPNHVPVGNIHTGSIVCALFSEDKVWYRAQVVALEKSDVKVRFIDFGNVEVISNNALRDPPELFYQMPPLAICCRLASPAAGEMEAWSEKTKTMLEKLTRNKRLTCTAVSGSSAPPYLVKLEHSFRGKVVDIASELQKGVPPSGPRRGPPLSPQRGLTSPRRSFSTIPPPGRDSSHPSTRTRSVFGELVLGPAIAGAGIGSIGSTVDLVTCVVYHPSYFFVKLAARESIEGLNQLMAELNQYYAGATGYLPFEMKPDTFCACKFLPNNTWYRGYLKNECSKGWLVYFLDFGNTEVTSAEMLRPLEERFMVKPFAAILCSLACVEPPDGKLWSREATNFFKSKVIGKSLKCTIVYNSTSRLFVDAQDPESTGESLRSGLVAHGLAKEAGSYSLPTPKEVVVTQAEQVPASQKQQPAQDPRNAFVNTSPHDASPSGDRRRPSPNQVEPGPPPDQRPNQVQDSAPPAQQTAAALFPESESVIPHEAGLDTTNQKSQSPDVPAVPLQSPVASGPDPNHSSNVPATIPYSAMAPGPDSNQPSQSPNVQAITPYPAVPPQRPMAAMFPPVFVNIQSPFQVLVSEVTTPNEIYFNVAEPETLVPFSALFQDLNTHFQDSVRDYAPVPGELCCAKFSADQCWYRAVACTVGPESATVQFVDYGNADTVAFSAVRPIPAMFTQLPFQARRARLAGVNNDVAWAEDRLAHLRATLLAKPLVAKVTRDLQGVFEMEFYDTSNGNDVLINSLFVTEDQPTSLNTSNQPNPMKVVPNISEIVATIPEDAPTIPDVPPAESDFFPTRHEVGPTVAEVGSIILEGAPMIPDNIPMIPEVIPTNDELEVIVSEVNGPDTFWVQNINVDAITAFAAMATHMNAAYESAHSSNLPAVKVGDVCCSKFSLDGQWYRARVAEVLGNGQVRIFYVDFGNQEVVDQDGLKQLDQSYASVPAQAIQCTLAKIVPAQHGGTWSAHAIDWLKSRIYGKRLVGKVVERMGSVLKLELIDTSIPDQDVIINAELVHMGEARCV